MIYKKEKFAFTVAEVLITLSIVGVIAAMTIPLLINEIEKHTLVSQFKDTYSLLSNAVQKLKVDYGSIDEVASMSGTVNANFMEAFQTELKFAKVCTTGAVPVFVSTMEQQVIKIYTVMMVLLVIILFQVLFWLMVQ